MYKIGLFSRFKNKNSKPSAFVFVDYEHWYVSMIKKYSLRPRVRQWRDSIAEKYDIKEMLFFADFSNPGMRTEIPRIREVTNLVIETQNTSPHYKKDFNDFIMLDYIYQKALSSPDVGTFIIFTGDGHFSSVVRFLAQNCGKKVIIYAVRDGLSGMLKSVCSKAYEIPTDSEVDITYFSMIAKQIKDTDTTGKRLSEPSFSSVINSVSEYYGLDREIIKDAANKMSAHGYITVTSHKLSYNKRISTVRINKEKIASDGISLIEDPLFLMMPARVDKKEKAPQAQTLKK